MNEPKFIKIKDLIVPIDNIVSIRMEKYTNKLIVELESTTIHLNNADSDELQSVFNKIADRLCSYT